MTEQFYYERPSFDRALNRCLGMEREDYAAQQGRCPGKTLLLIRQGDGRLVGTMNIRWNLTPAMLRFAGHIGYAIRPTEQRRGYGKINLYMGLMQASIVGLNRVMVGCAAGNVASDRTIQALGGVLERCEIDPEDDELSNVYWIDVQDALRTHKSTFEKHVFTP